MMARGSGSESDVLEFDLRATELESDLNQLQQEYLGYIVKLKVLLGEDTRKSLTLSGELPHQHLTGSLENYVDLNLSDSPSVRASALAFEIATYKADTAKKRWLPKIDLESKFGSLPGSESSKSENLNSSVAIVATWEIFSGFNATYEKRELYAQKNLTDWELKAAVIEILADVQIQFGELQALQSRSDLEKDNVRLAKRYYDLVLADFKRGYKNSGDFSAAAQTLYDAEVQKKKLDLEFIEKKLALENRLGRRIASVAMKDSAKEGSK